MGEINWCVSRSNFDEVSANSLKNDFTNCLPQQRVSERKQKNQTFGGILRKIPALAQSVMGGIEIGGGGNRDGLE